MIRTAAVPALLALLAAGCADGDELVADSTGAPPRTDTVRRADFRQVVLLTGEIQAVESHTLFVPPVEGRQVTVRWIAEDGLPVVKGQKVMEFDNANLVSELEQKELRLDQAVLDYKSAVATGKSDVDTKTFEVEKNRVLLEKARLTASTPRDLTSERDWQENQLALERAEVALAAARRELAAAEKAAALEVKVKRIEVERIGRDIDQLESSMKALTLEAPRDGIMIVAQHAWDDRPIQPGDTLFMGWPAVKVPDLSKMRVEARLSDVDDGSMTVGMPVRCTLDAYPELTFDGTVQEIAPVAQQMGGGSGLRRGFEVMIDLAESDPSRMRPGMSVKIEVEAGAQSDVLLVPRGGLDVAGEVTRARTPTGLVDVQLGPCNPQVCVVEGGLSDGQTVLVGGAL